MINSWIVFWMLRICTLSISSLFCGFVCRLCTAFLSIFVCEFSSMNLNVLSDLDIFRLVCVQCQPRSTTESRHISIQCHEYSINLSYAYGIAWSTPSNRWWFDILIIYKTDRNMNKSSDALCRMWWADYDDKLDLSNGLENVRNNMSLL